MGYIDMHCDTLMKAFFKGKKDILSLRRCRVDLEKLEQGGCKAQFFAIFMLPRSIRSKAGFLLPSDDRYIQKLRKILLNTISAAPQRLALARNDAELRANAAAGRISAFLTLEDGRAVQGRLERLEEFYERGIRLISLTWNDANCFGAPNSQDPAVMAAGLTPFGKAAVERMNELGMIVDVSHLSDGGFWDVAALANRPFVASHSNCRALCSHRRNLDDEMLRALGSAGGVAGLNFLPEFVSGDAGPARAAAQRIAAHARHMANVGGVGCVAIGTDFDGFSGQGEISSAARMPLLFDALAAAGFHEREIEQIAHENVERVIRDTMGAPLPNGRRLITD